MADTEPLLPKANTPPNDHPIFLRVCHSPWLFLGQKSLMIARGLLAVYMTAVLALDLGSEIVYAGRGRLFPFFISNVSYVIQIIYYWITFAWTVQHFLMPYNLAFEETLENPSFWSRVTAPFRIPRVTSPKAKNQIIFSIFYTAAVTPPFVVTTVFWLILVPTASAFDHVGPRSSTFLFHNLTAPRPPVQGGAEGNPLGDGALKAFVLINVNAINTIIALGEILVLSSVRKQKRLNTHIAGLLVFCVIYFLWTGVGRLVTGKYVYKYLDPNYKGWRAVIVAIINMMAMTVTMFLVQRGLHGLREDMTKKSEGRLHLQLLS